MIKDTHKTIPASERAKYLFFLFVLLMLQLKQGCAFYTAAVPHSQVGESQLSAASEHQARTQGSTQPQLQGTNKKILQPENIIDIRSNIT